MISLFQFFLPNKQDFLFYHTTQINFTFYTYIFNHQISKVLVKNAFDQLLRIFQRHKLGHLLNIVYDNCFFVVAQFSYNLAAFPPSLQSFLDFSIVFQLFPADFSIKTILDSGIKIYRNVTAIEQIFDLIL